MTSFHFYRSLQWIIAAISGSVLLFSFYLEYVQNLDPCILCLSQRACVFLLLGLALYNAFKKNIIKNKALHLFSASIALLGIYLSLRQVWLENLPITTPVTCLPDMSILIQYFPWQTTLKAFFLGSTHCGEVVWRWLGMSLATWSALYFSATFIVQCAILILFRPHEPF